MIEGIRLGDVMIDCDDAQKLCEFYHKLLGWEKFKFFGQPALRSENKVVFLFAEEKNYIPPVWPEENGKQQKQMHFNFEVPDLAAAVEYSQSLGAAKTASQYGGNIWVTMLDPAGHPFCLCAQGNGNN